LCTRLWARFSPNPAPSSTAPSTARVVGIELEKRAFEWMSFNTTWKK
jgi:hypothetical protein